MNFFLTAMMLAATSGPITSGGDPQMPFDQSRTEINAILDDARVRSQIGGLHTVLSVTAFRSDEGSGYWVKSNDCELEVNVDYVVDPDRPLARLELTVGRCPTTAFPVTRNYEHALVTPEQCEILREQGAIENCVQWATFEPDGTASVIVTDIVNSGTYSVRDGTIRVHLTHPGDLPTDFEFYLVDDGASLMSFFGGARSEWLLTAR